MDDIFRLIEALFSAWKDSANVSNLLGVSTGTAVFIILAIHWYDREHETENKQSNPDLYNIQRELKHLSVKKELSGCGCLFIGLVTIFIIGNTSSENHDLNVIEKMTIVSLVILAFLLHVQSKQISSQQKVLEEQEKLLMEKYNPAGCCIALLAITAFIFSVLP